MPSTRSQTKAPKSPNESSVINSTTVGGSLVAQAVICLREPQESTRAAPDTNTGGSEAKPEVELGADVITLLPF